MSGGKAKGGGEEIAEGTAVRVLYDSSVWYHGQVQKVIGHGAAGTTKCIVSFDDGETEEVDLPSKEAQLLLTTDVLVKALREAGQGRIFEALAAVLKKKSLNADTSNAIRGVCFALADKIREGKKKFKSEKKVVKELVGALQQALLDSKLLDVAQWHLLLQELRKAEGGSFRFSLIKAKDLSEEGENKDDASQDRKEGNSTGEKGNSTGEKGEKVRKKDSTKRQRMQEDEGGGAGEGGDKTPRGGDKGDKGSGHKGDKVIF
jgi:hypothetical protein